MSIHIAAQPGDIAPAVLLPGDPLRAQFVAQTFLKEPRQYNQVRNMFGYTGLYRGRPVSVQGTGMGMPSLSIYVNELFQDFGVMRAIRIGTAGAIQEDLKLRDLVIALAAATDSGMNRIRFGGRSFAPAASFSLLQSAYDAALSRGWQAKVGTVVSSDRFYLEDPEEWKLWAQYGCLAMEMECAELYTLAAKYRREALTVLTISDSLISHEQTSSEERQSAFTRMIEVALEAAIS
ncbi:MAG: purine-nucleoside phosphorylase [Treponema sp.]|jgi:purine-nucleoside phosphorylase|nr:purine-nucleoside phosphorylase [Treponema sp.]